jgi:hypothetical protein
VQRGWRWCLRPANLLTFAVAGLAVVVEIGLRQIGPPVEAWIAPGLFQPVVRDYLGGAVDWLSVQKVIEPLFLAPARWLLTVLVGAGLAGLLGVWLLSRRRPGTAAAWISPTDRQGLAYLYWLLLPPLAVLLFAADPEWKSPRYGLMLLPIFFLIAGGVVALAGRLVGAAIRRATTRRATTWGRPYQEWAGRIVLAATRETVPAYDWALAYVNGRQQPGDVVITFLCQASFYHLGRCDYLAIPTDYQGFAFQKEGQWVSGWDEVPIVDSAESLRRVLAAAPGAWFVIDEGRFRGRYTPEFVQAVLEGMELVAAEREMLVFHAPKTAISHLILIFP